MLPRSLRTSAWIASLAFCVAMSMMRGQAPAAADRPDVLEVNGIGSQLIPLNGNWQFHLGDDPGWAAPSLDDSHWEQITADQPWGAQTHNGYTGRAWYRRHIDFHTAPGADTDIALYMPVTRDACEVYWNGRLVGGFGKLPPHAVWYFDSVWPYTVGLGKPTSGVLAIRVWKAPYDAYSDSTFGGLEGPPLAGSSDAVANAKANGDYQWLRGVQFSIILNLLYALTAVLSFLAWLRDRRQRILGWMALYAAGPFTAFFLDNVPLLVPYRWDYGLLYITYAAAQIGLWYLLLELLGLNSHRRFPRVTFILAALSLGTAFLEGALQFFNWEAGPTRLFQTLDLIFSLATTLAFLYPFVFIPFAFRRGLNLAPTILAVVAMLNQVVQIAPSLLTVGIRFTHFRGLDAFMDFRVQIAGNVIGVQDLGNAALFATIVYALISYLDTSRNRQRELETEFRSARELQQFLIPDALPSVPGFSLTSAYRPAREVGGDFFQLIAIEPGATLIVLGDVSGKGLKAAMAVSVIVGAVRALASAQSHPGRLLSELNRRLYGTLGGAFATCAMLHVSSAGICALASAGHPPPLLNGRELEASGALPLGIAPDEAYQEIRFSLEDGDCLALYTDGLLEARKASGELFGFARLESLFTAHPSAIEAAEAAVKFGQDDDITVLTLTRNSAAEESIEFSDAAVENRLG